MNDLGQLRTVVSKSYIYNLIQNQTGLSIRTSILKEMFGICI